MRRPVVLALTLLTGLALVPAAGAEPRPFPQQVTDACGDAATRVEVGDRTVPVEAADPARDLAAAGFAVTHGPVAALVGRVESCGTASPDTEFLLQIGFTDRCVLNVHHVPRALEEGVLAPELHVTEDCYSQRRVREVSRVVLPASAVTFRGRTAEVVVPLAAVPAVTQPRFADGTVWPDSAVVTGDPEIGNYAAAGGTYPQPFVEVHSRFDLAQGDGYVVGQDAP